jgi:very-short-patch-repair endonuclease
VPTRRTSPTGYQHGRALRKQLTPPERRLWACLRDGRLHGVVFRRQHAIGPYVADFCSPRHHLVIEVDGSPHLQQEEQDMARTEFLRSQGYRVIRFWNNDVLTNMDGVVAAILEALQLSSPK